MDAHRVGCRKSLVNHWLLACLAASVICRRRQLSRGNRTLAAKASRHAQGRRRLAHGQRALLAQAGRRPGSAATPERCLAAGPNTWLARARSSSRDGKATFHPSPGAKITCNGTPFEAGEIHSDAGGHADILAVGDVKLILLKRGDRLALRLKDNQSPFRASFAGLRWYPPRADWRIEARFVAFPTPTKLVMDTIVGGSDEAESPAM